MGAADVCSRRRYVAVVVVTAAALLGHCAAMTCDEDCVVPDAGEAPFCNSDLTFQVCTHGATPQQLNSKATEAYVGVLKGNASAVSASSRCVVRPGAGARQTGSGAVVVDWSVTARACRRSSSSRSSIRVHVSHTLL